MTPSPSFREKQRAIKAHSMPSVPSVGQILASQNGQPMYPQGQQPSPTASNSSHQSRRSPPPASRISPAAAKVPPLQPERNADRPGSPPPLMHAHSQPIIPQLPNQHHPRPVNRVPAPFLTQYQNQEDSWAVTEELMAEFEREHGQYGSHPPGTAGVAYAGGAASSRLKPRHSDSLPVPLSASNNAPAKDPAVERVRATDRASPKDSDSGSVGQAAKRQVRDKEREAQGPRESPKTRDRSGTTSSQQMGEAQGHARTPEYRGSPQYQTPMASPGERTAAYTQYVPDSYQGSTQQQSSSQPPMRKPVPNVGVTDTATTRLTPPATSKLAAGHTPPLQAMATRPPDRSLPVQEEPEEDGHEYEHDEPQYGDRHQSSPTPSSDIYPEGPSARYDTRHEQRDDDDDDDTLNDENDDHMPQNKSSEDSESGFTPRSPSTNLPERPRDGQYIGPTNQYAGSNGQYGQTLADNQKTIRQKPRGGTTDQLGIRSFDPTMFERDIHALRGNARDSPADGQRERASQSPQQSQQVQSEPPRPAHQQPQPLPQPPYPSYDPRLYPLQHILDQRLGYQWNGSEHQSDDMQSLLDDPTSSYLQTFLRSASARPGAPVPPTPQSHTAAPSPSPLISATPSDVEPRQIGSPYPYPFTHIRRSTMSGPIPTPSTNYDMNNPAVIREQLALQMQIYALNNGLAPASSESAFSPSSTPFPGPRYNPWAFVPGAGTAGLSAQMAAASVRSSPSHQPVNLPPPPMLRGRSVRHREQNGHVRAPQPARRSTVKPPPRVDSTQPRETSPEPSSGEETSTAGEDRFVDQFVREAAEVNGKGNGANQWDENGFTAEGDDEGEWVDEEEDAEEDDLLDLEYHPTFVSNPQKRRRRFDSRWDALVQAFQALDRETDSTLVLLAAPSHSTKLHALTSRAIRRDPSLTNSAALSNLRRSFSRLAIERRAARKAQRMSLAERLSARSDSSADGSPGGNSPGEMDLRRALDSALASLGALSTIYEQREARWRDEMRKQNEDRERIELLLRQALGPVIANGHAAHHGASGP
ncbi:hypothetical protein PYCCODRAFT_1368324 [Trametes coccinea BRFM310]|uniref:Uncharacterized protein n=1 Tax=Trametes coccinea (strain BRFM310) TaxID=1353009 RepID=A0A1Y2ILA0_TRAC3|nr:hypothetical protein PYCCODRAFT_1368324 [Trametes coccinea BRFM310]